MREPSFRAASKRLMTDFNAISIRDLQQFGPIPTVSMKYPQNYNPRTNVFDPNYSKQKSAIKIQAYIRGYLVRKNSEIKNLKRFFSMTKKLSFHMQLYDLVETMKFTHRAVTKRKQEVLNGYINYCAIKIQKVFRGH